MKEKLSLALTLTLVSCALVITGLVVRRELAPAARVEPIAVISGDMDWPPGGWRVGAPDARVDIVLFEDFQCPACARVHEQLDQLLRRHPDDISIYSRHFPLEAIHPHAFAAAIAADCAGMAGRFAQFRDLLYRNQASIGAVGWAELAARAGIQDRQAFEGCLSAESTAQRVRADIALATRLGLNATPTLIINRKIYVGSMTLEQLEADVEAVLPDH